MVLSSKEKQQRFRAKHSDKFRALNMLLTNETFDLLTNNAKLAGMTKVAYLTELLHSNPEAQTEIQVAASTKKAKTSTPVKDSVKTDTPKDIDYDGITKLGDAVAKVVGCSASSNNTISKHTKRAKDALGLNGAVTKEADKIAIVEWLRKNSK